MIARAVCRRFALLLPLLMVACGSEPRRDFPPLNYSYLSPLRLNVANIQIEQRFVPSGVAPDVSQLDPIKPVDVLRGMAQDRLQPFGSAGQAVFVIKDASLTRRGDTVYGNFSVELDIYTSANVKTAYAEANVTRARSVGDDLRGTLYDVTKDMMDQMNVEFEFQVRRSLKVWMMPESAAPTAVQQQPLTAPGAPPPPPGAAPSRLPAPTPLVE